MVCLCHPVGVGNVVLQVASTVNCKECIGIEKAEIPSAYAQVTYSVYYCYNVNTCTIDGIHITVQKIILVHLLSVHFCGLITSEH